jgi:hypothetical protein
MCNPRRIEQKAPWFALVSSSRRDPRENTPLYLSVGHLHFELKDLSPLEAVHLKGMNFRFFVRLELQLPECKSCIEQLHLNQKRVCLIGPLDFSYSGNVLLQEIASIAAHIPLRYLSSLAADLMIVSERRPHRISRFSRFFFHVNYHEQFANRAKTPSGFR